MPKPPKTRQQAFWDACAAGDATAVQRLAGEKGVDPEGGTHHGFCAACRCGHDQVIRWFCATLPLTEAGGMVPIHRGLVCACEEGKLEVARYLLTLVHSVPANVFAHAYEAACRRGHADLVAFLDAHEKRDLSAVRWRRTMRRVCRRGHVRVAGLLLRSCPAPEFFTDSIFWQGVYHAACRRGDPTLMAFVEDTVYGSIPPGWMKDKDGDAYSMCTKILIAVCLKKACEKGHADRVALVLARYELPDAVKADAAALASHLGRADVVKLLC